jgi:hypothetical protein
MNKFGELKHKVENWTKDEENMVKKNINKLIII